MVQDNIPVGAAGYTLLSELDDLTWDSWLSLADVATAMNTKAASQGAIFANGFTNTYLTYLGIALVFNHANLTAANAAAIFNEAGLTAANSALIFNEAGLTAANSALIFNEAGLTAANSALIFNEAGLTAANSAAIFNEAGLTAARSALICNEAGFTFANKALMFREAGLSIANINAIIIHANITDDNAQQILSEITKANRDLTSAANIYEFLDDFADNKLTGRDGAGTTSTGFTNVFAHKDKFRPEWTTDAGSASVSGGKLVLDVDVKVSIPSTFNVGTWELKITKSTVTNFTQVHVCVGAVSKYLPILYANNGIIGIYDSVDSAYVISSTEANDTNPHTFKTTRSAASAWEAFFDGASVGTGTDATTTSFDKLQLFSSVGTNNYDDLKVW